MSDIGGSSPYRASGLVLRRKADEIWSQLPPEIRFACATYRDISLTQIAGMKSLLGGRLFRHRSFRLSSVLLPLSIQELLSRIAMLRLGMGLEMLRKRQRPKLELLAAPADSLFW